MDFDSNETSDIPAYLLPYLLAGRVDDQTYEQAMDFVGQENDMMRDALGVSVIERHAPLTLSERDALLDGWPAEELVGLLRGAKITDSDGVAAWIRQLWKFEPAAPAEDPIEREFVARSQDAVSLLAQSWRIGRDGDRRRSYVAIFDAVPVSEQDLQWHRMRNALLDLTNTNLIDRSSQTPLLSSIAVGWDWPVYYRDMVANSRLLWSASGEDVDLAALAAAQPHDG